MNKINIQNGIRRFRPTVSIPVLLLSAVAFSTKTASAEYVSLDIISTLNYLQGLLTHIGPLLSGILFIIAGIFYAIGQLFPAHQRATFHATSMDIIIGAVIVAVLSVASNGLALASTHLLSNLTNSSV